MPEYRLHCFGQSGNAYKVALMLALTGADWEPVFVDFFHGATRDAAFRAEVNEMGEVPVLEVDGERLTQSGAILDFLADRIGRFKPSDEKGRREVWRWILFDNHKFTSYFATFRFMRTLAPTPPDPAVLAFFENRVKAAFSIVERHLARQPFLVGDKASIADLSLAGYIFYPQAEHGLDIAAAYPAIDAWRNRLRDLPGWRGPYDLMPTKAG